MRDLIERQEAIKAVDDLPNCYNGYSDAYDKAHIIGVLEEVPSAQSEIIRCKDCRWWDKYNEMLGYCMAARHCHLSEHWEISIRRTYKADFYCADAERRTDGSLGTS